MEKLINLKRSLPFHFWSNSAYSSPSWFCTISWLRFPPLRSFWNLRSVDPWPCIRWASRPLHSNRFPCDVWAASVRVSFVLLIHWISRAIWVTGTNSFYCRFIASAFLTAFYANTRHVIATTTRPAQYKSIAHYHLLAITHHQSQAILMYVVIKMSYVVDGISLQKFSCLSHICRIRMVHGEIHGIDVRSKEITDNRHFGIALQ